LLPADRRLPTIASLPVATTASPEGLPGPDGVLIDGGHTLVVKGLITRQVVCTTTEDVWTPRDAAYAQFGYEES